MSVRTQALRPSVARVVATVDGFHRSHRPLVGSVIVRSLASMLGCRVSDCDVQRVFDGAPMAMRGCGGPLRLRVFRRTDTQEGTVIKAL